MCDITGIKCLHQVHTFMQSLAEHFSQSTWGIGLHNMLQQYSNDSVNSVLGSLDQHRHQQTDINQTFCVLHHQIQYCFVNASLHYVVNCEDDG